MQTLQMQTKKLTSKNELENQTSLFSHFHHQLLSTTDTKETRPCCFSGLQAEKFLTNDVISSDFTHRKATNLHVQIESSGTTVSVWVHVNTVDPTLNYMTLGLHFWVFSSKSQLSAHRRGGAWRANINIAAVKSKSEVSFSVCFHQLWICP